MTTAAQPSSSATRRRRRARPAAGFGDDALRHWIDDVRHRHPSVGLAVGVVRDRTDPMLIGRGLADIAASTPVTEDTVFRIGSVTKLFTAIGVMQLAELGLLNLDAPANDYLRAYRLIALRAAWRPASTRHLLTHTAGVPDVRRARDLLHAGLTPSSGRPALLSVNVGESLPSLADYYRAGLRVVIEPGTAFAYSNHGFATLGQLIEDVSGLSLVRYFRVHIFEPLGMSDTDLVRSERVATHLATGYVVGRSGPRAVPDREWIGAGGGGIYATPRDLARFVAALLGGGANEHGRILDPATLATMFEPHYRPDPRVPGMGLGFFRGEVDGHRIVSHDGILPGFNSALLLAPDDGVGLFALTNGSSGAFAWLPIELDGLLRRLLGAADESTRGKAPHHPEVWAGLSGRYRFPPRIADLRMRLMLGAGAEVLVSDGRLMVRLGLPIPAAFGGLPLEPDDPGDPDVFRVDASQFGIAPVHVVFSRGADGRATAAHTDLGGMPVSLIRRADGATGRRWTVPALGAVAAACLMAVVRDRGRRKRRPSG